MYLLSFFIVRIKVFIVKKTQAKNEIITINIVIVEGKSCTENPTGKRNASNAFIPISPA